MADLLGYVKSYIPETHRAMVTSGEYDGEVMTDVFERAISVTMDRIFVDGTTESDLDPHEFLKSYVAALVARQVIGAAIDYWQVKTHRAKTSPAGVGPIGGESVTLYDKVDGLLKIDERLKQQLILEQAEFVAMAGALLRSFQPNATSSPIGMTVSSRKEDMKSLNPDTVQALISGVIYKPPYATTTVLLIKEP